MLEYIFLVIAKFGGLTLTYRLFDARGNRLPRTCITATQRRAAKAEKQRLAKNAKRRERYALARAKEPHAEWRVYALAILRAELVHQGWREYYMQRLAEGTIGVEEAKAKLAQHGIFEEVKPCGATRG